MEKLCFLDRTSSLQTQFIKQVAPCLCFFPSMHIILLFLFGAHRAWFSDLLPFAQGKKAQAEAAAAAESKQL
jgi:hypothetical protein